jgi:hypothetical protein
LLVGMDDDCVVVVVSWEVDVALEVEVVDDVTIVEEPEEVERFDVVEDVVDVEVVAAETENCACTCTLAVGHAFEHAVTYTVY